jgi:hypothetical protein
VQGYAESPDQARARQEICEDRLEARLEVRLGDERDAVHDDSRRRGAERVVVADPQSHESVARGRSDQRVGLLHGVRTVERRAGDVAQDERRELLEVGSIGVAVREGQQLLHLDARNAEVVVRALEPEVERSPHLGDRADRHRGWRNEDRAEAGRARRVRERGLLHERQLEVRYEQRAREHGGEGIHLVALDETAALPAGSQAVAQSGVLGERLRGGRGRGEKRERSDERDGTQNDFVHGSLLT